MHCEFPRRTTDDLKLTIKGFSAWTANTEAFSYRGFHVIVVGILRCKPRITSVSESDHKQESSRFKQIGEKDAAVGMECCVLWAKRVLCFRPFVQQRTEISACAPKRVCVRLGVVVDV